MTRIGGPANGSGQHYKNAEHLGHLVLFANPVEDAVDNQHGTQAVARCEWIACVDCGKNWDRENVFGAALVPALCEAGVEVVAAIIEKGVATPGRSAPWLLGSPSADDLARAESYIGEEAF